MPRLTPTHKNLLAMIVWATALIAIDRSYNKHLYGMQASPPFAGRPEMTLQINHLCCSGCYDSTFQAMKRFSWLGKPRVLQQVLPTQQQANQVQPGMSQDTPPSAYSGEIAVDVNPAQIRQVDFVELDRAIRDVGLVPAQIKVSGIPHFELVAYLPHFCCHTCEDAAKGALGPGKDGGPPLALRGAELEGAPVIDFVQQQVRARFRNKADVTQFLRALERIGFAPRWVHLYVVT